MGGGGWREDILNRNRYGCIYLFYYFHFHPQRRQKKFPAVKFRFLEMSRGLPRDEDARLGYIFRIHVNIEIDKEVSDQERERPHPGIIIIRIYLIKGLLVYVWDNNLVPHVSLLMLHVTQFLEAILIDLCPPYICKCVILW